MTGPTERLIRTESVRIPPLRFSHGSCLDLSRSISEDGLHRPITVWTDGTLISGSRRLFAHMLTEKNRIQAVFVDNIDDAAKRLLGDNEDDLLAVKPTWTEVCRLWEVLRRLDEPAALLRRQQGVRRGVEMRRMTEAGKRQPGRTSHSDDYLMTKVGPAFGMSGTTARRLWTIYSLANGLGNADVTDERRELARHAMARIDLGQSSISGNYKQVAAGSLLAPSLPKPTGPVESAEAAKQQAAWNRALPGLEGLVAGLVELGPPNPELTWEQVGPVCARLAKARRDLELIIKKMRESAKS